MGESVIKWQSTLNVLEDPVLTDSPVARLGAGHEEEHREDAARGDGQDVVVPDRRSLPRRARGGMLRAWPVIYQVLGVSAQFLIKLF